MPSWSYQATEGGPRPQLTMEDKLLRLTKELDSVKAHNSKLTQRLKEALKGEWNQISEY